MAELSVSTQAVLDAVGALYKEDIPEDREIMIATLRAAADQVVPPEREKEFFDRNPSLTLQKAVEIRAELLAIADELETK